MKSPKREETSRSPEATTNSAICHLQEPEDSNQTRQMLITGDKRLNQIQKPQELSNPKQVK
ncbi:hypothetical protein Bca4012_019234 [Brassica carinata]